MCTYSHMFAPRTWKAHCICCTLPFAKAKCIFCTIRSVPKELCTFCAKLAATPTGIPSQVNYSFANEFVCWADSTWLRSQRYSIHSIQVQSNIKSQNCHEFSTKFRRVLRILEMLSHFSKMTRKTMRHYSGIFHNGIYTVFFCKQCWMNLTKCVKQNLEV